MKSIAVLAFVLSFLAWEVAWPDAAGAQSEPSICGFAASARARGSPAAPGLERQCQAALKAMEPSRSLGRVKSADPFAEKPVVSVGSGEAAAPDPSERHQPGAVPPGSSTEAASAASDERAADRTAERQPSEWPDLHPECTGPYWDPCNHEKQAKLPPRICAVDGLWSAIQSNKTEIGLAIEQNGADFHGSANFRGTQGTVVDGRIVDRGVSFRIRWNDGHVGHYSGWIDAAGHLNGQAYDETNAYSTASWFTYRSFNC